MSNCNLCPRNCTINRDINLGFCKCNNTLKLAKACLHFWEEPIISGTEGSGTVFFSGCHLKCVYCQNYEISHNNFGKEISVDRLSEIFKELEQKGANNINLVSGSHYTYQIISALEKTKLSIPIVWNSSGYENIETLTLLKDHIDIYIPDLKYSDNTIAKKYSFAPNYFEITTKAIKEMYNQTGNPVIENNLLKKGVIIRHLMLPDMYENTRGVIDWLSETFKNSEVFFSLMGQYTPQHIANKYPEINRNLTQEEYEWAISYCRSCGIQNGFTQSLDSASVDYIPLFNLEGI